MFNFLYYALCKLNGIKSSVFMNRKDFMWIAIKAIEIHLDFSIIFENLAKNKLFKYPNIVSTLDTIESSFLSKKGLTADSNARDNQISGRG